MMFRLLHCNPMYICRIAHWEYLQILDIHTCQRKQNINTGKLKKYANYSTTLHGHKILLDKSKSRKSPKIKLKEKSYEDLKTKHTERLMKKQYQQLVAELESHRQSLEQLSSSTPDSEKEPPLTEEKSVTAREKSHCVFVPSFENKGIYAVNFTKEDRKKKPSKKLTAEEKLQKKEEKDKKMREEKKKTGKKENLKRNVSYSYALRALKSYIEASVNAGEVEKAHEYLWRRLEHFRKKYEIENITNVDMYNSLLSGWAQRGRLDKIKQVFLIMEKDGSSPNLQSYASYLECIARGKYLDVKAIQQVANEMKLKGLSHKDILLNCVFKGDQREKTMEALLYIDSKLPPPVTNRMEAYSCRLLQKLNDKSYMKGDIHPDYCVKEEDIVRLSNKQLQMEDGYSVRIKSVTAVDCTDKMLRARKYWNECEETWKTKLTAALKKFKAFSKLHYRRAFYEESIYPYLSVIDTEILVRLLLQEVRLLAETGEFYSPREKTLYKELGIKVMNHYFIRLNKKNKITDKVLFIYQKYLLYLLDSKLLAKYNPREYWEYLKTIYPAGPTIDLSYAPWSHPVLVKIGSELYDILQRHISFTPSIVLNKGSSKIMSQVFYITYEDGPDVKVVRHIRTHYLLCKLCRDAQLDYLEFDASLVPMLSPPKPWVKYDCGGLLVTTIPLIRFNDNALHQSSYYSNVPAKELYPCFDSVNNLSLCPWLINKPLLDIIIDVFQKGGNEELDIPLNPNDLTVALAKEGNELTWRQRKDTQKKIMETTSLWFDCLYKLSIANHFRNEIFWFPHNLDFRGRVYPTPPHFNHLGSDMARSILLFAEGKPLGKKGLEWLKIQLINLTGFKKREPHHIRLEYANEMIPEIFDSADHPFEGNQWWKTSDKPWQTLACCKELVSALRHPVPEEYISHYPIHQDGSCNGLQHYAALGRDKPGAIEVNLHPADAPHDVYSGVSALVERERQNDAAKGVEVAKVLEGFVQRKVVKQTVMTFVYGVTQYGAKLQILKQLKDLPGFPEKYYHEASMYLMKKIFLSIKEMFTATQEIQDWFTDCAEQITRVSGDTLEWVTPLGLPVIQPYHKEIVIRSPKHVVSLGVETSLNYTSYFEPFQLPNIRKQKNGFAPNFIHSLDASHMMLTSLFCERKGITFVSVHDCYWTHASTVEIMNKICREQFVSLHKEPILENLSAFFLNKYARVVNERIQKNKRKKENSATLKLRDILSKVPKRGNFDLDKVLESEYFFS